MPEYVSFLPHLNAALNTTSALLLLAGLRFIRAGQIQAHRNCQVAALLTSIIFLISYLTYHYYSRRHEIYRAGNCAPRVFRDSSDSYDSRRGDCSA